MITIDEAAKILSGFSGFGDVSASTQYLEPGDAIRFIAHRENI
jgi:hypothetical protein